MRPDCVIDIPIRVVSEANARQHWRTKARRTKEQRGLTFTCVRFRTPLALPAVITFTRFAPGKLDSDNLAGAFKAVRDGVADAFGVDDGDERYDWRYQQAKAKAYGIRIRIKFLEPQCTPITTTPTTSPAPSASASSNA